MSSQPDRISDRSFRALADLIGSQAGVVISPAKRTMLETRLAKRVRALGLGSFEAYHEYVESPAGRREEWGHLLDAVTTHKTDFFREPGHFDHLLAHTLPELRRTSGAGSRHRLRVWSAACSTGEEPYTIAMLLADHAESVAPRHFEFHVEGSDISEAVLVAARAAIYPEATVQPVPEVLRRRYFLHSRERSRQLVRVVPEIRARVSFHRRNLMDAHYSFTEPFDIVFCRNVLIYFARRTQEQVLARLALTLRPGGYLFLGHAESLNGLDLPLAQVAPTIYRRPLA